MLEGNVQNVFFSEKLSRKDPGDLQDARPGATLGDFLGEVATFEADEAGLPVHGCWFLVASFPVPVPCSLFLLP